MAVTNDWWRSIQEIQFRTNEVGQKGSHKRFLPSFSFPQKSYLLGTNLLHTSPMTFYLTEAYLTISFTIENEEGREEELLHEEKSLFFCREEGRGRWGLNVKIIINFNNRTRILKCFSLNFICNLFISIFTIR